MSSLPQYHYPKPPTGSHFLPLGGHSSKLPKDKDSHHDLQPPPLPHNQYSVSSYTQELPNEQQEKEETDQQTYPEEDVQDVNYGSKNKIHKHIYVHVPPPELEKTSVEPPAGSKPQEKHYRIIFIKAPTAPPAVSAPAAAEREEKTLVYVLVKKPEEGGHISAGPLVPTQPSKPEVYFIRYKPSVEEGASPNGTPGGYAVQEDHAEGLASGRETYLAPGYSL